MENFTQNSFVVGGEICFGEPEEDYGEFLEQKKVIQWIAYKIIAPIVVGIGLLGNMFNLIVLTRPAFSGVIYSYLIGLAFSDLSVLLCAVPMMIRQSGLANGNSWPVIFFYSHIEYPLSNFFMASSIFIVICLTIDRFVSVWLPSKFTSIHNSTFSRKAIGISYLVAIVVSLPLSFINTICVVATNDTYVYLFKENFEVTQTRLWRIYIYSEQLLVRFGPAIFLAVLNFLIIWRFREITNKRRELMGLSVVGQRTTNSHDQILLRGEMIAAKIYKEEKHLVTLLTTIIIWFFVTTTPVAILGISYSESFNQNLYYQIFRAVANDLELCNFAFNFYIYFLCSKEFRKKFLSFFSALFPARAEGENQPQGV